MLESNHIKRAVKSGEMEFGKHKLRYVVLENGVMGLSVRKVDAFLGGVGGGAWRRKRMRQNGGLCLTASNLTKYIGEETRRSINNKVVYRYYNKDGPYYAYSIEAVLNICQLWMEVENRGELLLSQKEIARRARQLFLGLAHIGLVSVVGEGSRARA